MTTRILKLLHCATGLEIKHGFVNSDGAAVSTTQSYVRGILPFIKLSKIRVFRRYLFFHFCKSTKQKQIPKQILDCKTM